LYHWFHKLIKTHDLKYDKFSFEPIQRIWFLIFLHQQDKTSFQEIFDNNKKDRTFRFKGCPLRFKELDLETIHEIQVDFEK